MCIYKEQRLSNWDYQPPVMHQILKPSSSSLQMEMLKTKQQDKMKHGKVLYKNFSDSMNEQPREWVLELYFLSLNR